MTIDEAVIEIEKGFKVETGFPSYVSQTGEPYVEIGGGGVLGEGEVRTHFETQDLAIAGAIAEFRKYAAGKSGTLYWRIRPECEQVRHLTREKESWAFYMRLLISNMPVLKKAEPEKAHWSDEYRGAIDKLNRSTDADLK